MAKIDGQTRFKQAPQHAGSNQYPFPRGGCVVSLGQYGEFRDMSYGSASELLCGFEKKRFV